MYRHSIRLPGLVAHQEVIFEQGQTLSIRMIHTIVSPYARELFTVEKIMISKDWFMVWSTYLAADLNTIDKEVSVTKTSLTC